MLKRLLFAVFVLGLVFSLSGTAISGIGKKPVEALNPINWSNPNAPLANDVTDARPATAEFKKPISEVREYQMSGTAPSVPQTYFCDLQYYYDDTATAVWIWSIPDAWGDDLMNMRFTTEEGIECTLKTGWQMMLTAWTSGTPDFRMYLWDDDGFGFPGNKLDSVTILNADIGTGTWWWAEGQWPQEWVMGPGEEYHIGWTTLGGDGDTLWIASDKATGPHSNTGEERASENWAGFWGTMLGDWGEGYDVCFFIESERCCYELPYSDCYSQRWDDGIAYYWRAPHPDYDIYDYAVRFTVAGLETLSSVDLPVYDMGTTPPNVSGNDDLIIKVWDDDAGYPGTVLATEIVPAGTYPFFPSFTNIDFYSHNLVFDGEDFYVSFGSSGIYPNDCEATLSDDVDTPTGRSYCYYGGWWTMMDLWGDPFDMNFIANMCIDPYWDCTLEWYDVGPVYFWNLPDAYGDFATAQLIKSVGQECQVKEVSWALYDWLGDQTNYQHDTKFSVNADAGGLPGAELASIIVTPAEYVLFPGYHTVDFTSQAVNVGEFYWVVIESFSPTEEEGIAVMTDFGGGGWQNGAAMNWAGFWGLLCVDWGGVPCDIAYLAESRHCCIPFDERNCEEVGLTDWTTHQMDYTRSGASGDAFGDAQCDLSVLWCYEHPLENIWYTGPAISGDRIACAWNNEVQVLDLATGANIYTLTGMPLGNNIRCTPTIHDGVMYLSGGDQESMSAWNFGTGAMLWSRDITTVGVAGLFGITRYANMILLDQGGTLVLYFGTDDGDIVAVDASSGNLYAGWATNPVSLGKSVLKSGSTDGVSLFYNTYPGGVEGDVYSIDAASGAINWQLSTAGGLQANAIYPEGPQGGEGFAGGNSNENGVLYVNSHIAAPYHPGDGVMYAINTNDGSIKWAVPSIQASASRMSGTPVIDESRIYYSGRSWWSSPPAGGLVLAFVKKTGASAWTYSSPEYNGGYGDMALSCEPDGVPDLLFHAGSAGFLNTINSENGDEIYRRRISRGAFPNAMGLNWAIAPGYLAMSDFYGTLYVLAKGDDRPRMELQTYQPALSVEFGAALSLHVPIPNAITNTGCADLTFGQLETNLTPNHASIPTGFVSTSVRPDVMDRAASITDKLIESFHAKAVLAKPEADDFFVTRDRGERMLNLGANAGVPFLQYATEVEAVVSPKVNDLLAPGDTIDIVLDVNQSLILRGPQDFFMVIPSDDPDFFLHGTGGCEPLPYGPPEIHVTIVGGCLIDTTTMVFGMGGGNVQLVTNTCRIGTGDWTPHAFDIDGDDASFYQGSYIWANGVYEQATHTQDWASGGGEANAYWSMQPDPNWCDDLCKAHLDEDVFLSILGGYSTDGYAYAPIKGNRVCATYLDSMQNFDLGGGWDWSNFGAPFDNDLTMGLMCNSRTVGAVDFEPLKDLTVQIMEITERNGDPVEDWRMGAFIDYDVGANDLAFRSEEGSAGIVSHNGYGGGDTQWGMIKFPFGCGETGRGNANVDYVPLINTVSGAGPSMWYELIYMGDSAWSFLNRPAGEYTQVPLSGDAECHFTIAAHDFAGGDTYELAVGNFGLHGTSGTDAEVVALAKLANKWLGFGRGDVNGDGIIDLGDAMCLFNYLHRGGPGPIPFMHLGDVNCDGAVDDADLVYILDYLYAGGPSPCGDWVF